MTKCVYVASSEGQTGKAAVALGLIDSLVRGGRTVGVFRPVVTDTASDEIGRVLIAAAGGQQDPATAVAATYEAAHADLEAALTDVVDAYAALDWQYDVVVAVGSDWVDVSSNSELRVNAAISANLNAPVVLTVSGLHRTPAEVRVAAEAAIRELAAEHNKALAVVVTRVTGDTAAVEEALAGLAPVVSAMPESPLTSAAKVRAQFEAVDATVLAGSDERLDDESLGVMVGAMTLPHLLERLEQAPETTLITAADRTDVIPGVVGAHRAGQIDLAGLLLVGGFELPAELTSLITDGDLPVATQPQGTFDNALALSRLYGFMSAHTPRKVEAAKAAFAEHVDAAALTRAIDEDASAIRTPLAFQHQLQAMAAANKKTIVLPESSDDRILESAAIVTERGFADVILLGEEADVRARAAARGWDLSGVRIVSPADPELVEKFSAKYAELRAKKGVTVEQARETMRDLSYFATMMIYFGMADGMVSGAVNTTANTIKPSFEFIKTKPGVKVVSSSFLMCMPDRVLVFGDCAVNPNPTPEQLADIAIGCAGTAERFGIDPRVAMLSYSTGTSGKGEDVDLVAEATRLAKEAAPDLKLDGPIQFDAAVDMTVGSKKMPGSQVAGQATVFIFPDLNTGNNTYKAVQRSSGALAIGPVLQGLNKPVNDLSRGALVDDIVNTVAITAIQAQDDATAKEN